MVIVVQTSRSNILRCKKERRKTSLDQKKGPIVHFVHKNLLGQSNEDHTINRRQKLREDYYA